MTALEKKTELVRSFALNELGFDACGFSRAIQLDQEARRLEEWLNKGMHADMHWMERNFDKRIDPTKLVPGAKTVVSVLASYYQPEQKEQTHYHFPEKKGNWESNNRPKIAKYAQGRDYHRVLKKKLMELYYFIEEVNGGLEGRAFVDSAPVLDRAWALQAGLAWQGKNSMLLERKTGSYFFIGELIIDTEFKYHEGPPTDHCGSCTRCIDACPTDAIYEPYKVDSNKCISYLTIELKEQIPSDLQQSVGNWMYGCDICQEVCPWNRKAKPSTIRDFDIREPLLNEDLNYWEELNVEEYNQLFEGSAIRRAKFEKFKMNALNAIQNIRSNQDSLDR